MDELLERMRQFPVELARASGTTLMASLLTLQESVPPYPSESQAPPGVRIHKRTGLLGRSLGSTGEQGGGGGTADIFQVRSGGGMVQSARFGSRVQYAPRVIGELGTEQQQPWASYWWNIKTIADRAQPKILRLFQTLADKLAAFLDRQ